MHIFDQSLSFVGGLFGYLILWALTIGLLWAIIKLAFATTQVTKGVVDGAFSFVE